MKYNSSRTGDYRGSSLQTYLNGTYYNNCSEELKAIISPITIPCCANGGTAVSIANQKVFALSAYEMCGVIEAFPEGSYTPVNAGIMLDLYKQKTGFTSPNRGPSPERVPFTPDGEDWNTWLRDGINSGQGAYLSAPNGCTTAAYANDGGFAGVLPACFIAKSTS